VTNSKTVIAKLAVLIGIVGSLAASPAGPSLAGGPAADPVPPPTSPEVTVPSGHSILVTRMRARLSAHAIVHPTSMRTPKCAASTATAPSSTTRPDLHFRPKAITTPWAALAEG